jgi:EamA domain-containing membrane protein RarD
MIAVICAKVAWASLVLAVVFLLWGVLQKNAGQDYHVNALISTICLWLAVLAFVAWILVR